MQGEKYLKDKIKKMGSSDAGVMAGIKLRLIILIAFVATMWFVCDRIVANQ